MIQTVAITLSGTYALHIMLPNTYGVKSIFQGVLELDAMWGVFAKLDERFQRLSPKTAKTVRLPLHRSPAGFPSDFNHLMAARSRAGVANHQARAMRSFGLPAGPVARFLAVHRPAMSASSGPG